MGFIKNRLNKKHKPINTKLGIGILVLMFVVYVFLSYQKAQVYYANVWVDGTYVYSQLAITPQQRDEGLGGVEYLPNGEGMFFIFEQSEQYIIWMKDMKIPIDIIWIDKGKIVDIAPEVKPPESAEIPDQALKQYIPRVAAHAVLEVPAGFAGANDWKIGDKVKLELIE